MQKEKKKVLNRGPGRFGAGTQRERGTESEGVIVTGPKAWEGQAQMLMHLLLKLIIAMMLTCIIAVIMQ